MAGIVSIPQEYFEAAKVDGANAWQHFWHVTVPLVRPATITVIILSLIGGLRSFDLIWAMTRGGPGFTSDVIASVIYKQYQAGFYGLSTAGNVMLFLIVTAIIFPLFWLNRKEVEHEKRRLAMGRRQRRHRRRDRRLPRAVRVHRPDGGQDAGRGSAPRLQLADRVVALGELVAVFETRDYMLVTAFINSTILTVASVAIMVILAAMVGWVLQRRKSRWTGSSTSSCSAG